MSVKEKKLKQIDKEYQKKINQEKENDYLEYSEYATLKCIVSLEKRSRDDEEILKMIKERKENK